MSATRYQKKKTLHTTAGHSEGVSETINIAKRLIGRLFGTRTHHMFPGIPISLYTRNA